MVSSKIGSFGAKKRVEKIANDIARTLRNPVVACCVLKGAYGFFSDLTSHLKKLKSQKGSTS